MKKYKILLIIVFTLFIIMPFQVFAYKITVKKPFAGDIIVEVESSDTIEAVKGKIYQMDKSFLPENQKLVFNGMELKDERTLADYPVPEGSIIQLINKEKFKVILDANDGKFANSEQYIIEEWDNTYYENLPVPVRNGYKFLGYFTEKTSGTKFEMILNESGIDSDMTFYAQWEEATGSGQGSSVEENPQTFDGIWSSILVGTISVIGIVGTTIYLKKRNRRA